MGDRPRYSWRAGLALAAAVAATSVVGYLISRPSHPLQPVSPRSTTPLATQNPSLFGPQSTGGFSVADDPASGEVVVFGGIQDDEATWLWNGTRWDLAAPKVSPPGRIDAAAAYDPALHLVLLFGGHGAPGTDLHDTWAWGGTTWRELDSGVVESPPADADMAWDPTSNQMVLIAAGPADNTSTIWVWSGSLWTRKAGGLPTRPTSVAVGFDPTSQRLLAVGLLPAFSPNVAGPAQTWAWSGSNWRPLLSRADPVADEVLAVAWDPVGSQLLLFADQPSSANPAGIWSWSGSGWVASTRLGQPILDGIVVTTNTSLLLVGALDSTGLGQVTRVQVFSWSAAGWRAP